MSKRQSRAAGGGIGLLGGMFLLFLGLKLAGVITWSWLWVTAPLWCLPAAMGAAGLIVCILAGAISLTIMVLERDAAAARPDR